MEFVDLRREGEACGEWQSNEKKNVSLYCLSSTDNVNNYLIKGDRETVCALVSD